jgi:hypothetical protein
MHLDKEFYKFRREKIREGYLWFKKRKNKRGGKKGLREIEKERNKQIEKCREIFRKKERYRSIYLKKERVSEK